MNKSDKMTVRSILIWTVASSAVIAACVSAIFFAFSMGGAALSILAGTLVAMTSFVVLVLSITGSIGCKGKKALFLGMISIVKLSLIGALIWWLIARADILPVYFLAGFSVVPAVLLFQSLRLPRGGKALKEVK